jgi:predicted GH43/DUF377 family glycosyl hydrolase
MFVIRRSAHNPLLSPLQEHPWEAYATYNWCPIKDDKGIHYVYRALAYPQSLKPEEKDLYVSSIGYTFSSDEVRFEDRRQFIAPEYDWERFGCEDPRVTYFDGKYYIFYTALSVFPFAAPGIKLAAAVTPDFKTIERKELITDFNAKAMVLFPEKIAGKYMAMLTVNPDLPPSKMCFIQFDSLDQIWSKKYWSDWYARMDMYSLDLRRTASDHTEVGAPPIKTDRGWLLIYSHIQDYFTNHPIFGIEALLLDLNNPTQLIGRTTGPFIVPEEVYERFGHVANIVFPTGALVYEKRLRIYYSASDTTCCYIDMELERLLASMQPEATRRFVTRFDKNPILTPIKDHPWEAKFVYNPAAIDLDGKIRILYRAQSEDNTSVFGYADTSDGFHIENRLDYPVYVPREDFEMKRIPGGYSGCEDPRLIELEGRIYVCYTVYDGIHPPRAAVSSITRADFVRQNWNWSKPVPLTPEGVDDKDTCIFPEKVRGKYMILHRVESHVCADYLDSLEKQQQVTRCIQLFGPRPGMWDHTKVGIASPPIKTDKGWVLFYHGVAPNAVYRVGAALLDLNDPAMLASRTAYWIMEPEMPYETEGLFPNAIFPCGTVVRDDKIFMYYGAGDTVIGVATLSMSKILEMLTS